VSETLTAGRFREAIVRFDSVNGEDQNMETAEGISQPKELLYAKRMTETLNRFAPNASEVVRLAARCQHIRRWTIPRESYPVGRDGYRKWRTDLAQFHAETASKILNSVGYDAETIGRVRSLLRKERLKADREVQLIEDVACLVFLSYYLPTFVTQHQTSKVVDVLRKTWRKMSEDGHSAALKLDFGNELGKLVAEAISPGDG
tara:strand:- start:23 stop:631 length:609 start_codon:yes stop_codon:yes gene_type:complete